MPSGKIPFGSSVVRKVDETFVADANVAFFDGYLNSSGLSVKRPGLVREIDLSTISGIASINGVNGLFLWRTQKKVVAVAGGKCAVISKSGSTYTITDVSSAVPLTGRIYFAYDSNYFYLSDGGKIMYSDGTAASLADLASANAPTSCSHVNFLDSYILGTNSNTKFQWSAIGDGLTWSALDFATAAGDPDNIVGQVVFNRQIFNIGASSTEIWINDGETPFSRADGGFIERGCIAPSSILKTKVGVIWLDNDRNLVISNGGQPEIISPDYKGVIDSLNKVDDCETHFIEWKDNQFILLNFITEQKTFVYCLNTKSWSEWGFYSGDAGSYTMWMGRCYLWMPDWGLHLVGSRTGPRILSMSDTVYRDDDFPIRFYKRTGFIDHGNTNYKRCNKITLKILRGFGAISSSSSPKLMLRWRADGSQDWSNIQEIDLGKSGDPLQIVEVYPRGAYYTRQYEISCTENVPLVIADADEDYSILR